jgi:hypothetical protein
MAAAKVSLAAFFLASLVFLPSLGCLGGAPQLRPALYAGDSSNAGFTRKQSNETIRCTDTQIDDLVAMHYADLQCNFQVYVLGCAQWKPEAYKAAATCNAAQLKRMGPQKPPSQ